MLSNYNITKLQAHPRSGNQGRVGANTTSPIFAQGRVPTDPPAKIMRITVVSCIRH